MTTVVRDSQAATSSSSVYVSNHDPATLRTHEWRNVANSAAYLVPYLKPDLKILDVGCGPGTITIDLARYVPEGYVIGVEYAGKPLITARQLAEEKKVTNVQFAVGDALDLNSYVDKSFDLVHAHQVLQHVSDPVKALREMKRVVKPGGIIASRESAAMTWYPKPAGLDEWYDIHHKTAKELGGHPDPGSYIHVWAQEAGFERQNITCSAGTWCFSTPDERQWWSNIWVERVLDPSYVEKVVQKGGYCTKEDLSRIASTWEEWGKDKDGWFTITHGEMICRK